MKVLKNHKNIVTVQSQIDIHQNVLFNASIHRIF